MTTYILELTGSTFAEWRQIIHSGNMGHLDCAATAGLVCRLINIPLGGIMSGLIQSTSTEFFRGSKYFCIYFFFYNAANTARTGYIQFAGAQLQISVEIVQPLAAVNGGDRLTLNTDGTSTFHLVLRLQLLRSIGYEIENSCR
jgi:hypothetical protein